MSKTLNELTYSILEAVTAFSLNDDTPISVSWVEDQIVTQNNTLIRKAHQERRIDQQLYMLQEPVAVKPLDKSFKVGNLNIHNKTDFCYADIPALVTGLKGREIDFVSNTAYTTVFIRKPVRSLMSSSGKYYSLHKPSYAVMRNRILLKLTDLKGASYIAVNGIWRDPREISTWDPEEAFPTPSEKNLEILSIQHIGHALGFPPDLINDAQRAIGQPAKQKQDAAD